MNTGLKSAREKAGLSQVEVAGNANVSESAYQNYEYDKREPSVRTAIRIAKTLHSTVEELFGVATPTHQRGGNRADV